MDPHYEELLAWRAVAARPSEELIALVRTGNQTGSDRVEAAEVLGYRRCTEAIPALIGMLAESNSYSVAAAEALAKIAGPAAVSHLERTYEECKAICARGCLHWDENRLEGVLAALLRLRNEEELSSLQHCEGLESYLAGRELERRRAAQLLEELFSRGQAIGAAAVALHQSGQVEGWAVPLAVEALTGLPFEESRSLLVFAFQEQRQAEPSAADVTMNVKPPSM